MNLARNRRKAHWSWCSALFCWRIQNIWTRAGRMRRRPAQAPCEVRFPHRSPCGRGHPPAGQVNTSYKSISDLLRISIPHAGEGMAPGTYVGIVHRLRHLVPNQERRVRFPLPAPIVSSHPFTARRECRRATSPHSPDGRALDLGSRGRRFEPGCGDHGPLAGLLFHYILTAGKDRQHAESQKSKPWTRAGTEPRPGWGNTTPPLQCREMR